MGRFTCAHRDGSSQLRLLSYPQRPSLVNARESSEPGALAGLMELFAFVGPYRGRFIAAFAASLLSMSFGLMFPWLVGRLLDAAIPSLKVLPSAAWKPSVDAVAGVLIVTLAIQAALTFFSSYSFNRVGECSVVALRKAVYGRIVSLPMQFFGVRRVGELTSRLSNDLAQIQDVLTFIVAAAIRQSMLFAGGIVMIAVTSWRLALVMISSFPVLIIVAVIVGRRIRKLSRTAQDRLADSAVVVEESLQNIATVKAFGNEAFETRRYGRTLDEFLDVILRTARNRAALIAFIILGIFGSIVLVLWQGAHQMRAGLMSHGDLTTFMLYTTFVGGAVGSFAEIISQVQKSIGATQRIRELLVEPTEKVQRLPGEVLRMNEAGTEIPRVPRLGGDVTFDRVSFRYPSRPDLPVLRELTLTAAPGEKIALVGPSGAGKSTTVALLLRYYDPDSGRLTFDGKPAADYPLETIRANLAVVAQEVLLFGGTIRENIAYGRTGATEAEIVDAARRAHCEEFITRFPERYDTLVGDRGIQLSGGQRQRIALARAFLRDPAVLVLDEATSSLDAESEHLIQQALDTLLAGRTAIIIAHRLATVRRCDRIFVIENGEVVESGTHDELLTHADGRYRRLAQMQFTA
jgi:ABC-type multidrug transport system fused ATPase/permease subunit